MLISSCTIEKRHYRSGFYWDWNRAEAKEGNSTPESVDENKAVVSVAPVQGDSQVFSGSQTAISHKITHREQRRAVLRTSDFQDSSRVLPSPVSGLPTAAPADDPKPEEKDKINPLLSWLVGAGLVFELSFLLMFLAGTVSWMGIGVLTAVFLGVLFFALAMWLRKSYAQRIAAGEKNEKLRLSAHFHRFKTLLHIYFAAAAMGILGWILLESAIGPLGFVGTILASSGMVLVLGVALVLLVLFVLYLIRWRKDPTGYKPKRDPHPPKDR